MHTHALRCVFPGCKFSGGPDQKDIDRHVQEKHGTTNFYDPETFLAEASNKTLPAVKPHATTPAAPPTDKMALEEAALELLLQEGRELAAKDRPPKPEPELESYHEEVEHIPSEYDSSGEAKISPAGELLGGRLFLIRTFVLPHRSEKRLMLATECARVLRYRDSYLLFNKNQSLLKIIATQEDKDYLIQQEILPFSYRSRQIALVSARSIFRQFGARVVEGGRRVRDDYWEARAVKHGYTEEDMPEHGKSRSAKTVGVAGQAEHSVGFPRQIVPVTGGAATAPKASIPYPDWSTRDAGTESLSRNSGAWPITDQDLRMADLFREKKPSPSEEGGDSSVREATLLPTFGDCPSSSTTENLSQQSSSLETSTSRQYGDLRQHKNVVDPINFGRVDALGPPSQDYPTVILLSLYSIEQYFPSICFFYYALRLQSLKL